MSKRKDGGMHQEGFYRGIYEFEDPSGCLLAARVPHVGSADLYDGTAVIVRPNQAALFLHRGKIADVLGSGHHEIRSENVPILTRLANWRFGFRSPLRCELWFFSTSAFTGRRWGTRQPAMFETAEHGTVPITGFGNYTVRVADPQRFYLELAGNRASFDVTEVEDHIQGMIEEALPGAIQEIVPSLSQLNTSQREVARALEERIDGSAAAVGLKLSNVQVLSLTPPREVLKALGEKVAMDVIGDKREYLLFKAANGMEAMGDGGGDPMKMMMGMMLSKGLMGFDYHEREKAAVLPPTRSPERALPSGDGPICTACGRRGRPDDRFCGGCAAELVR